MSYFFESFAAGAIYMVSGALACEGYSGDVWPQQPAPPDHPWRTMPRHAMTPHYSGDTIDAQVSRYPSQQLAEQLLGAQFKKRALWSRKALWS